MTQEDRNKIIQFSVRADEPTSLFDEVCQSFQTVLRDRAKSWKRLAFFEDHAAFIDKAVAHYLGGDYLSSIQVLYPRIEGIMRQLHLLNKPGSKPQQRTMVEALVADHSDYSLLLPARFREYLIRTRPRATCHYRETPLLTEHRFQVTTIS